ncbi:MAG: hypothetical protein LBG90_02975 [Spirochaetaceae bacterium]|nr:hypothetical protein [Spirochaetaceae bacterium]
MKSIFRRGTFPLCVCAGERVKLIGSIDGRFPAFGHHLEKEMGGLWLPPIKLFDGFWLKFRDCDADRVDLWVLADAFEQFPEGNAFFYTANLGHTPIRITRFQMVPELAYPDGAGMLADYEFFNSGREPRNLEILFLARTGLRPVWFSEEQGLIPGPACGEWLESEQVFLAKNQNHEWYAGAGSLPAPDRVEIGSASYPAPEYTEGQGPSVQFRYNFQISGGETRKIRIILAGSCLSRSACLTAYRLLTSPQDFRSEKKQRYRQLLEKSSLFLEEDPQFQSVYDWVKVNTDWLIIDAGKFGRALAAGLPEYPWWFGCDTCYALQGILAIGDFRLCRDTLLLLLEYSEKVNGNGRIIHEVTTAGFCYNPGNTQETAHFITMVWHYFEWTGDRDLLDRVFPFLEKSAMWLRSQDPEDDGFPKGYGIIEIPGLNSKMLDTAAYTAQSYGCFSKMCALKGLENQSAEYADLEKRCIERINTKFWDEEAGLYADTYTTGADVRTHRDDILGRLYGPEAEEGRRELDKILEKKGSPPDIAQGWLLNYAWIINIPMEIGIAPPEKAKRALERLHSSQFIGPYGMYLSGLFRDQTMTISTGVMAAAQVRYGYPDRALELLKKMASAFGLASPGCISEMLPDYGCFIQAWTVYAVMVPIVTGFFGLKPYASLREIHIDPRMPQAWSQAELRRVPILDGELTIRYRRLDGEKYEIEFTGTGTICFPVPQGHKVKAHGKIYLPGSVIHAKGRLAVQVKLFQT